MKIFNCLILVIAVAAVGAELPRQAGIGVGLGVVGKNVIVRSIFPGSPAAAQHDLRVSDRILAVAQENEPAIPVENLAQAVRLLRGPQGTTVRLTVFSAGEDRSQARVVSLLRGEFKALSEWGDGVLLTNGMKAPDIEMISLPDGKSERLSDYAGKVIVLEFWATWCGPCEPKVKYLQGYAEQYAQQKDKVIFITASVDDNQVAPVKFIAAKGLVKTHNVLVGTEAKRAFHLSGIPTAYIIDKQGKIAASNPEEIPKTLDQALESKY
jgi:thiol-disulfide isomerase/thioredoxin